MSGMESHYNKQMSVFNFLRTLAPNGSFISESTIFNHLKMRNSPPMNQFEIQTILGQLCNRNVLEMFIPLNQAAACGSGCCGTTCGGGGRYYRIKIGGL